MIQSFVSPILFFTVHKNSVIPAGYFSFHWLYCFSHSTFSNTELLPGMTFNIAKHPHEHPNTGTRTLSHLLPQIYKNKQKIKIPHDFSHIHSTAKTRKSSKLIKRRNSNCTTVQRLCQCPKQSPVTH